MNKHFELVILGAHQEILEISKLKSSDDEVNVREGFFLTTYYRIDNDEKKTFRWGWVWRFDYRSMSYNNPDAGTLEVLEKASAFLSEFNATPNLPVKLKTPLQRRFPNVL